MKKLALYAATIGYVLVFVLATYNLASAQTVTCSVSGATARQAAQFNSWLTTVVNPPRVAQGLPPFANFAEWCAANTVTSYTAGVSVQDSLDAGRLAAADESHGAETAAPAQCSSARAIDATIPASGCTKHQVACAVLAGNGTCS